MPLLVVLAARYAPAKPESEAEKRGPATAIVPNDVSYSVIETDVFLDIKRSLDVRLNKRVSEEVLRTIALKLKSEDPREYERTFISYYLPGMEVGAGSWASTHFDPTLEVKIYGTTIEEHDRLLKEAASSPPSATIGRWMASERTGFPGVITIFKEGDTLYQTQKFQDGTEGRYELVTQNVNGQVRYKIKQVKTSDYVVILPNGDLGHCDHEEMWATSRKVQ